VSAEAAQEALRHRLLPRPLGYVRTVVAVVLVVVLVVLVLGVVARVVQIQPANATPASASRACGYMLDFVWFCMCVE